VAFVARCVVKGATITSFVDTLYIILPVVDLDKGMVWVLFDCDGKTRGTCVEIRTLETFLR